MDLPKLSKESVKDKKVFLRMDLDVDLEKEILRLEVAIPTLRFLLDYSKKIFIIGHKGRPKGYLVNDLSLKPFSEHLSKKLSQNVVFIPQSAFPTFFENEKEVEKNKVFLLENIRFWPEEEENDKDFAASLSKAADFYVNEAFAASHREHASIVSIPKYLPHAAGFRFFDEVENLSKVFENPQRPVLVIISGAKKDKINYLAVFKSFADKILIAGRLPEFMPENIDDDKFIIAQLTPDKEDITIHSIEKFEEEITKAATIVVGGPIGKFEDEGHRQGTERIFTAVANSKAFKITGGGETQKAISMLGLEDKFNWISVGGGAMLEFLANRTLPGIKALSDA